MWNISSWDDAKWGSSNLCEKILQKLDEKKEKDNNSKDALIAETAILNDLILVTNDNDLRKIVKDEFAAPAISLDELLRHQNPLT